MKINPLGIYRNIQKNSEIGNIKKNDKTDHNLKQDKLTLSKDAVQFAKILKTAKETEVLRQEKVNSIKEKIKNGTYKVDSSDIAEKIINNSLLSHRYRK